MVIGLIGRLYDDPRRIAQTHEAVLEAIENGDPEQITAQLDRHIRVAWGEVAKLVRDIPTSSNDGADA
jgi:DNA-binding GntR family transcriptional regulator